MPDRNASMICKTLVILLCVVLTASACNDNDSPAPSDEPLTGVNRVVLGPVANAVVVARSPGDPGVVASSWTSPGDGSDIDTIGRFDLDLLDLENSAWLLVSASGGLDTDADDDGILDDTPTPMRGEVFAVGTVGDWRTGSTINPLSDLGWRLASQSIDPAQATPQMLSAVIDATAAILLDDIDGDGNVTHRDLLAFDPARHTAATRIPWNELAKGYIPLLHSGDVTGALRWANLALVGDRTMQLVDNDFGSLEDRDEMGSYRSVTTLRQDGSATAWLGQLNEGALSFTRVNQNANGATHVRYQIHAAGQTLHLVFDGGPNVIMGTGEAALQQFARELNIRAQLIDDSDLMRIEIPKALLVSIDQAYLQVADGQGETIAIEVIDADPILSWRLHGDCTGPACQVFPIVEDSWSVENDPALAFDVSSPGGPCQGIAVAGVARNAAASSLAGPYPQAAADRCVSLMGELAFTAGLVVYHHTDETDLVDVTRSTTLLHYDPQLGTVYPPNGSPSATRVALTVGTMNTDYILESQWQRDRPAGPGWLSAFSVAPLDSGAYVLGDADAAAERVWLRTSLTNTSPPYVDTDFSVPTFSGWSFFGWTSGVYPLVAPYFQNERLFIQTRDQQTTLMSIGGEDWQNYTVEADIRLESILDDAGAGFSVMLNVNNAHFVAPQFGVPDGRVSYDGYHIRVLGRDSSASASRVYQRESDLVNESLASVGDVSFSQEVVYRLKVTVDQNRLAAWFQPLGETERLLFDVETGVNPLASGAVGFGGADSLISIDNLSIYPTSCAR